MKRALALLALVVACQPARRIPPAPEKPLPTRDAGRPSDPGVADMGSGDAGFVEDAAIDAGLPIVDAGDAGSPVDAGVPPADAGTVVMDGCGAAPGANDRAWTVRHDGLTRTFYVHVPDGYDPAARTPVVIDFHGRLSTATQEMFLTGMRGVADREGFIAVHPEGTDRTWNGGLCCGAAADNDVDDVGFTAALLDELEAQLCIDDRRVYATGLSNGGIMVYRLACELSDRIAAIAPVAGVHVAVGCAPTRAVSVFHFHGTEDNVVPYDGFGGFASAPDSVQSWVSRNHCDPTPSTFFAVDDVSCDEWTGCDDGAVVRFCTIDQGGHTWPGGPALPGTTQTIDASDMIWSFFQNHPMP